ncbi:hypothetical protein ACWDA7_48225 [Streptomyces sp. NPDC001156]
MTLDEITAKTEPPRRRGGPAVKTVCIIDARTHPDRPLQRRPRKRPVDPAAQASADSWRIRPSWTRPRIEDFYFGNANGAGRKTATSAAVFG